MKVISKNLFQVKVDLLNMPCVQFFSKIYRVHCATPDQLAIDLFEFLWEKQGTFETDRIYSYDWLIPRWASQVPLK